MPSFFPLLTSLILVRTSLSRSSTWITVADPSEQGVTLVRATEVSAGRRRGTFRRALAMPGAAAGRRDGMKATSGARSSEGRSGVAMRKAGRLFGGNKDMPEGLGYSVKRRLLGPPLVNEELGEQRLSKGLALGVLAPDGISSSAYGTEEILIGLLLGGLGLTAFTVILPLTMVVLFVMVLVVLSYREVVTVYTRAGGSYVVARENFGPRVAQVAAVALLIDYVVTVAVQVAAGTAAIASLTSSLQPLPPASTRAGGSLRSATAAAQPAISAGTFLRGSRAPR